jgi:hypothetical protein
MTDNTKRPVVERQVQSVRAKIWDNQRDHGVQHATTFSKVYRDQDGNVREAQSFGTGDLPALSHLSGWALDEIQRLRDRDRGAAQQRQTRPRRRERDQDRDR